LRNWLLRECEYRNADTPSTHCDGGLSHGCRDPALLDEPLSIVVVVDGGDNDLACLFALCAQSLYGANGQPVSPTIDRINFGKRLCPILHQFETSIGRIRRPLLR